MRIKIVEDKGETKSVKFNPGDRCYCVSLKGGKYIVENAEIHSMRILRYGVIQYEVYLPLRLVYGTKCSRYKAIGGNIDKILFKARVLAEEQAKKLNSYMKKKSLFYD